MAKKEAAAQAVQKKKQAQEELKSLSGTPRLKEKYADEVASALKEKFGYKNVMEIPKLEKIVLESKFTTVLLVLCFLEYSPSYKTILILEL